MSRFASQLQAGSPVKKGQVIGYVGQSGLATGPHCHFEFRKNGKHYDPVTVNLPANQRLTGAQLIAFKIKYRTIEQQLAA